MLILALRALCAFVFIRSVCVRVPCPPRLLAYRARWLAPRVPCAFWHALAIDFGSTKRPVFRQILLRNSVDRCTFCVMPALPRASFSPSRPRRVLPWQPGCACEPKPTARCQLRLAGPLSTSRRRRCYPTPVPRTERSDRLCGRAARIRTRASLLGVIVPYDPRSSPPGQTPRCVTPPVGGGVSAACM